MITYTNITPSLTNRLEKENKKNKAKTSSGAYLQKL